MKNFRIEDELLVYDCTSSDCETPGESHKVPLASFIASMRAICDEFLLTGDPRLEAALIAYEIFLEIFEVSAEEKNSEEVREAYVEILEGLKDKGTSFDRFLGEKIQEGTVTVYPKPPKFLN